MRLLKICSVKKATTNAAAVYIIIHIINVNVNVSKNIAKTIREMMATIDATSIGQRVMISKITENNITNNNATKSSRVIINPPFMLYLMNRGINVLLNWSYCVCVCIYVSR